MKISAVLSTRGDVDLTPILETLPYEDIVIWDAKKEPVDYGLYSRYVATSRAKHDLIYFQDDDILFREHDALLDAFDGRMVVNMDEEWIRGGDYYDCSQVGGGSLVPRGIWEPAFSFYLSKYPDDTLFRTYADFIPGTLVPFKCIHNGFEIRPEARDKHRICMVPGSKAKWTEMRSRCRQLRDGGEWSHSQ